MEGQESSHINLKKDWVESLVSIA